MMTRGSLAVAFLAVCGSCGPAVEVRPAEGRWVRLQMVRLHPDQDPAGIAGALAEGGSFDHVVLVHTPGREEVLFSRWDAPLGEAALGSWYPAGGGEPWPEAAAWARGAREGEVSPPLRHGGATFLLRMAERLEPGAPVAAGSFRHLFEALDEKELRDAVETGRVHLRFAASEVLGLLEQEDATPDEWPRHGRRWLLLAHALGSDALAMRVLAAWSRAMAGEHRMQEAAALNADLLRLAERHNLSERARALIARMLAEQYAHGLSPFAALEVLGRQLRILRAEGRYIVLCALAEQFEDFGLAEPAFGFLDDADRVAAGLSHVHGPNHHLIRSRLLLAAGRKEEALREAWAANDFALRRMHVGDHISVGIFMARLLLERGEREEAEHLAELTVRRCQAYEEGYGEHICPLPALWVVWEAKHARRDEAGARAVETELLEEAGRRHSAMTAAEVYSLLAVKLLPTRPQRGMELFRAARRFGGASKANHVALDARLAVVGRSLATGRDRDLADELADELFHSFGDLRESTLPLLPTPQKRDEVTTLSTLLDYYLGTGRQARAVRVAERIAAANVFRSILVLAASPERLAPLALVRAPEPRAGSAAGRRLERFATGLLDVLEGEEPYPYARLLEPGDLFLCYHVHGDSAYLLSWFAGEARVELLASRGEPPAARIARLRESVLDLGSRGRRTLASYRAAEEAYALLLGSQEERLGRASRLVISPGPELETLPFGLLRSGGRALAMRLPIVYVDTGLPVPAPEGAVSPGPSDGSVAVFADPRGDLPATRAAMRDLARGRPGTQLHTGKAAAESALWAVRGRPAVLHLATHARVQRYGDLEQVVVQLAPGGGHDGEVALSDWLLHFAARPELVSVVACRSGAATGASRDLARLGGCLAVHGVPWVLTAFWRVEEEPSACFSERFLGRALRGERPDRALHRTILHLEKECPEADESVWAPFRLSALGGRPGREP